MHRLLGSSFVRLSVLACLMTQLGMGCAEGGPDGGPGAPSPDAAGMTADPGDAGRGDGAAPRDVGSRDATTGNGGSDAPGTGLGNGGDAGGSSEPDPFPDAGGDMGGDAGSTGARDPDGGTSDGGTPPSSTGAMLPTPDDYGARGPFETRVVQNTGPNSAYTLFRPVNLGQDGFLHPPATWGNGITTTPSLYTELLSTIASHGIIVIGSNNTQVSAQQMMDGLDWLIARNDMSGDFQGHIDVDNAATIGYSWGGMGAVNSGSHEAVTTTVSMHGLEGAAEELHGPLLLFTATGDTFVDRAGYVQPTYDRSTVQTALAEHEGQDHLYPLGNAGNERAPTVAWLRLWLYGDQAAEKYFYGDGCILCSSPWADFDRKNWQ